MHICLSCEGVLAGDDPAAERDRCGHCGTRLLAAENVHFPERRGETDTANPLLGSLLAGKYRLQSVLGRGGMGTVFRAVHEVSHVPLAVKLLHPRFSAKSRFREALLAESRKAGRVVHDNCARVFDVGETDDGTVYLAMELAEGETADAFAGPNGLPPATAATILLQVCRALVAIHAAGLVHRDLSARNVIVALRGGGPAVKVLDFGIAKSVALAAGADDRQRADAPAFANPVFSAPEHLAGQDVDARADLYSFGVLACLLLAGKLPVDAADPREAARETVAGRLRLPAFGPGVPRRLQRLVQRCLTRDPALRPPSAQQVLGELETLVAARRPMLQRLSVAAFAVAAVTATLVLAESAPPFLSPVAGTPVRLAAEAPGADAPVQHVRPAALETWTFRFGGFVPSRLQAELSRGGTTLLRSPLVPETDDEGRRLVLSAAQRSWRDFLGSIASASEAGPVDLAFVVPGLAPLGSARVRVDGSTPSLQASLTASGGAEDAVVVNGATSVEWKAADPAGIAAVEVTVRWAGAEESFRPDAAAEGTFPLGQALARARGTVRDLGAGAVTIAVADPAGNRSAVVERPFAHCDVAAAAVEEVLGERGLQEVLHDGETASLRVRLAETEPGCRFALHDMQGRELVKAELAPGDDGFCTVRLPRPPEGFAGGLHRWTVEDRAGNVATGECTLRFRSTRIDAVLAPRQGAAVPGGTEIVLGPPGGAIAVACSPDLRIDGAVLTWADGSPLPEPVRPALHDEDSGATRIDFPQLPYGAYRLRLQLSGREGGGGGAGLDYPVRVLPERIAVHVPRPRSRFLPGVVADRVLARGAAGYRAGSGWRCEPECWDLLRGRVWTGGETLAPAAASPHADRSGLSFPELAPIAGHNVLALELEDVLERPVAVFVGGEPAPVRDHAGRTLHVVADFWWNDGAPLQLGEDLLVEYGQPAVLKLRLPLALGPDEQDQLRLSIVEAELSASGLAPEGDGASIATFVLPFLVWQRAAKLEKVAAERYPQNLVERMDARLATPFAPAPHDLSLRVRTARSTLRPFTVQDLGFASLPPPLAELRFVPVLEPGGPLAEAVPEGAPGRALFRAHAAGAVRNLDDFLLQDREVTRAQYAALLELAEREGVFGERAPPGIVHADDPLGSRRLALPWLVPSALAGDVAAFRALVAAGPERPVTGVDFFQAHAFCRLLGALVAGDPALFRLPLGCEVELAAFGSERGGLARNGPAAAGAPVRIDAFRAATVGEPPTAAECAAAGDVVLHGGAVVHGLDFGVREWVLDLPQGADLARARRLGNDGPERVVLEWVADAAVHRERALQFALGTAAPAPELAGRLRTFAVVRGLALGETGGLLGEAGEQLDPDELSAVPASVPGALRCEQMRRDGRDVFPDRFDPRLFRTGFRLAGGRELTQKARGF